MTPIRMKPRAARPLRAARAGALVSSAVLLLGGWAAARAEDAARIQRLAREVTPAVVAWRRDFHAHPELANREERTARVVAEALRAMGADDVKTGVARHGVVASIRGRKPGDIVALRADMDALAIREQTGLAFASQNDGVMHACGHDAHTAILLGAARVLVQMRDELPGTVRLLFQPAEEGAPLGEEGGAKLMIKEGALDNPTPSAIFGLHVSTELKAGQVGYRFGATHASVDHFRVTLTGKQSHAAFPWHGEDPIVAMAHVITAIQTIPSRHVDARRPVVVSVGIAQAGTAWNIIPGEAVLEGTVRTHDAKVRQRVLEYFRRIVENTAVAHGTRATILLDDYGPPVWNSPELGKQMLPTLAVVAGQASVVEIEPIMGGEDFSHYAERIPGFFLALGVADPAAPPGSVAHVHTPQFVVDEAALPVGVRLMASLAIDYLRAGGARKRVR